MRAGEVFLKVTSKLGVRGRLSEQTATMGLAAALRAFVEAPIMVDALLSERHRPDILIGPAGGSTVGGVIEVKRAVYGVAREQIVQRGMVQLDAYLDHLAPGTRGALVLLNVVPPDSNCPEGFDRDEQHKTPAGRDVQLVLL
jgi:hypothetical protein